MLSPRTGSRLVLGVVTLVAVGATIFLASTPASAKQGGGLTVEFFAKTQWSDHRISRNDSALDGTAALPTEVSAADGWSGIWSAKLTPPATGAYFFKVVGLPVDGYDATVQVNGQSVYHADYAFPLPGGQVGTPRIIRKFTQARQRRVTLGARSFWLYIYALGPRDSTGRLDDQIAGVVSGQPGDIVRDDGVTGASSARIIAYRRGWTFANLSLMRMKRVTSIAQAYPTGGSTLPAMPTTPGAFFRQGGNDRSMLSSWGFNGIDACWLYPGQTLWTQYDFPSTAESTYGPFPAVNGMHGGELKYSYEGALEMRIP